MCVLLVEDEVIIASLMAEGLRDAGFEVVHAAAPEEALEVIERRGAEVSILVTDIHLKSETSGLDIVHEMRARHPKVPVIVATGRADALGAEWRREHALAVLAKPFTPSTLVAAVQRALA